MKKAIVAVTCALLAALLGLSLFRLHQAYADRQARLEARLRYYKSFSEAEAAYILANQLDCGAVLVYQPRTQGKGYVNPYFSCQSMLGLLADPCEEHLQAVERYLQWHTAALFEFDGIIPDYDYREGELIAKESDSVDAYAGKYFTLLCAYAQAGGDLDGISRWRDAVALLLDVLDTITLNEVVYIGKSFRVAYLMDNTEVWQGCNALAGLLRGDALAERCARLAAMIKNTVEKDFWDAENACYHIGLSKSQKPVHFGGFIKFYPDSISQLYPVITGMNGIGERERTIYEALCASFAWEKGLIEGNTFEWSSLAYAASLYGDDERLDAYLAYYASRAAQSRSYPMHTSNAGWIMQACGRKRAVLAQQLNESFFHCLLYGM